MRVHQLLDAIRKFLLTSDVSWPSMLGKWLAKTKLCVNWLYCVAKALCIYKQGLAH